MKKISANRIMLIAVLLGTTIMVTYANSVTMLYGGLELLIAGCCYLFLLLRWRKTDPWLLLFAVVLTGFSLVGGLRTGNIKASIKYGAAAAAIAVSRKGAGASVPSAAEVAEFMRRKED